jgi:hypothetical protein
MRVFASVPQMTKCLSICANSAKGRTAGCTPLNCELVAMNETGGAVQSRAVPIVFPVEMGIPGGTQQL